MSAILGLTCWEGLEVTVLERLAYRLEEGLDGALGDHLASRVDGGGTTRDNDSSRNADGEHEDGGETEEELVDVTAPLGEVPSPLLLPEEELGEQSYETSKASCCTGSADDTDNIGGIDVCVGEDERVRRLFLSVSGVLERPEMVITTSP